MAVSSLHNLGAAQAPPYQHVHLPEARHCQPRLVWQQRAQPFTQRPRQHGHGATLHIPARGLVTTTQMSDTRVHPTAWTQQSATHTVDARRRASLSSSDPATSQVVRQRACGPGHYCTPVPSRTKCVGSAMCTPSSSRPDGSTRMESASSRSMLPGGSMVMTRWEPLLNTPCGGEHAHTYACHGTA